MQRLGHRLRDRRIQAGESASSLARAAGWTQTYWHALEDGSRQAPGPEQIDVVARALGVPPSAGLLANLSVEAIWWEWTGPRAEHLAHRIVRAAVMASETLQDDRLWEHLLHTLYPSDDPGRRVLAHAPEVDRTRPETWPRVLLVDILCSRVAGVQIRSSDFAPIDGEALATNEPPGITAYVIQDTPDPTTYSILPVAIEVK